MAEKKPVVVAGAGIAGLTAALSLARTGMDVIVLERADHLAEIGAGLQLSPNASRILIDLGLGPALRETAVVPRAILIRDARGGETVAELPLSPAIEADYGAPYWVVHRGDLQAALLERVKAEPRIRLELGTCLEGAHEEPDALVVDAWIAATRKSLRAEALIGADGVWSQTRVKLLGGKPARYSGRTAWRTTLSAAAVAETGIAEIGVSTGLWLGDRAHLVHYPIRAGREINLIAAVDDDWIEQRWDVPGDPSDLLKAFAGWPAPVRDLLTRPCQWRKWALCAVDDEPWTKGRIALIGDAAHAMLPFVAQGGAMAIEDAAVLARELARTDRPVSDRLKAYAASRRPRATKVAAAARQNATTYHLSGLAASARNLGMRILGPRLLMKRMDWIWRWQPE